MAKKQKPEDKYYRKWGLPSPNKKYYSPAKWSFIESKRKKHDTHVLPKVWNRIVHALFYSELNQKDMAAELGVKTKYVRVVVAGITKRAPILERSDHLGPRQSQILVRKIKKRQSQAQIRRALRITRQQVSDSIARLEKKFQIQEYFRGPGRGGIDTYFDPDVPKTIANKEDTTYLGPKSDLKTYSRIVEGVRLKQSKSRRRIQDVSETD